MKARDGEIVSMDEFVKSNDPKPQLNDEEVKKKREALERKISGNRVHEFELRVGDIKTIIAEEIQRRVKEANSKMTPEQI